MLHLHNKVHHIFVSPNTTGTFFQNIGRCYNELDDWTLFDTYNVSSLYVHIIELQDSLKGVYHKLDTENTSLANSTRESILQMFNLTTTLEDKYHSIIQPPINRRSKRGLFNAIGRINKWLVGSMDDEDETRLNTELEKVKQDSTTWKSMALENIQLMNDTLKIVKEKSAQITRLQKDFIKDLERTGIFYLEMSPVYQRFQIQYDLILNALEVIQTTITYELIQN